MQQSEGPSGGQVPVSRLLTALFARPVLAVLFQSIFALIYLVTGSDAAWRKGADWWILGLTLVNISSLLLVSVSLKKENLRLRDLWRFDRNSMRGDVLWLILALILSGPLGVIPNLLAGSLLWGDAQVGAEMSFRAIPVWGAVLILVVFPITQALAELAVYFGYVMPRLKQRVGSGSAALAISAIVLALQHVFLPLLFDWRFMVWRAVMFMPFAFWIGYLIKRRKTLLPYLMIVHGLIDASLPIMVLIASLK